MLSLIFLFLCLSPTLCRHYYKTPLTVTVTTPLTQNSMAIIINTTQWILKGQMNQYCQDFCIRKNGTLVPYWVESGCNTGHTVIWIDISSFEDGDNDLFVHHGSAHWNLLSQGRLEYNGDVVLMYDGSVPCPQGFSVVENFHEKFLFVVNNPAAEAGGFSGHEHLINFDLLVDSAQRQRYSRLNTIQDFTIDNHDHPILAEDSSTASNDVPEYSDLVFCRATQYQAFNWQQPNIVFISDDSTLDVSFPLEFSYFGDMEGNFVRGHNTISGGSGGDPTHSHTFSINSGQLGWLYMEQNGTSAYTFCETHYHTLGGNLQAFTNVPVHQDAIFYKIIGQNEHKTLPVNAMIFSTTDTSAPPLGYTDMTSSLNGLYIRGSNIYAVGSGGETAQTHGTDYVLSSSCSGVGGGDADLGGWASLVSHTHVVDSFTVEPMVVQPPYFPIKVYKRKEPEPYTYVIDMENTEYVYWECFLIGEDEDSVCSGKGTCYDEDKCICDLVPNFYGTNCQEEIKNGQFVETDKISIPYIVSVSVVREAEDDMRGYFNCSLMLVEGEGDLLESVCVWETQSLVTTSLLTIIGVNEDLDIEELSVKPITTNTLNVKKDIGEFQSISHSYWAAVVFPLLTVMLIICVIVAFACPMLIGVFPALVYIALKREKKLEKLDKIEDVDMILKMQAEEDDNTIAHLKINKDLFEIRYDELTILEKISEGGSACQIFKCLWKGNTIAFKCFKTRDVCGDQEKLDFFEREVEILASVSHPNIMRFFGAVISDSRVGIAMEFCPNGDLKKFLQEFPVRNRGAHLEIKDKIRILVESASAIGYLHSRKIIHRDIKSENILLSAAIESRLIDFGLSKVTKNLEDEHTKRIGTSWYMSPEVVSGKDYDEKCDVFSFSIVMYETITNNFHPYGHNAFNIEFKVANNPNFRPVLGNAQGFSEVLWAKSLIKNCWAHHRDNRPSFSEILQVLEKGGKDVKPAIPKKKTYKSRTITKQEVDKEKKVNESLMKDIALMRKEYLYWKKECEMNQKLIQKAREEKNL